MDILFLAVKVLKKGPGLIMLSLDGTYSYYYGSSDSQPHVRIGFGIFIHLSFPKLSGVIILLSLCVCTC